MRCIGTTKEGKRCKLSIPPENISQVHEFLRTFETQTPAKAISSLNLLIGLGLCKRNHAEDKDQIRDKFEELTAAIQNAHLIYELKNENRRLKAENRELQGGLMGERGMRRRSEQNELEEKNRELQEKLEVEWERRGELERNTEEGEEELQLLRGEVSSLRARLTQVETDTRENEAAQRDTAHEQSRELWNDERRRMRRKQQQDERTILSMRLEMENLKTNESTLVNRVSELNTQLENHLQQNATMRSEILQVRSERNVASSQKAELRSLFEIAMENMDRIGTSLQKDEQYVYPRLPLEEQDFAVNDMKARLEEKTAGLVRRAELLGAQLSCEQYNSTELRQSLETTKSDLTRAQLRHNAIKEESSKNRVELDRLRAEFNNAQNEFEGERYRLLTGMNELKGEVNELREQVL